MRHRLHALALGGAALLLAAPEAAADGCLLHPAKLPDSAIEGFRARPGGLLDDYPKGGVVMSSAVRRLAGSEVATVPELVGLAKKAGVAQIVALGAGLAGTVNVCRQKRPDLAAKITDEIRRAQNSALFAAFAASLPSRQVAAMGAPEPLPPGRAALLEPQAKAPPPQDSGSTGEPAQKAPLGAPRASFGNGGIVRTVVRPVSPAR